MADRPLVDVTIRGRVLWQCSAGCCFTLARGAETFKVYGAHAWTLSDGEPLRGHPQNLPTLQEVTEPACRARAGEPEASPCGEARGVGLALGIPRCPACGSGSTWCVSVAPDGRHDRYCDDCRHEWQTFHPAADAQATARLARVEGSSTADGGDEGV